MGTIVNSQHLVLGSNSGFSLHHDSTLSGNGTWTEPLGVLFPDVSHDSSMSGNGVSTPLSVNYPDINHDGTLSGNGYDEPLGVNFPETNLNLDSSLSGNGKTTPLGVNSVQNLDKVTLGNTVVSSNNIQMMDGDGVVNITPSSIRQWNLGGNIVYDSNMSGIGSTAEPIGLNSSVQLKYGTDTLTLTPNDVRIASGHAYRVVNMPAIERWDSTFNTVDTQSANWLTSVNHDSNLSGDGAETPLGLSDNIVLERNGESAHITTDRIELLGGSSYGDPVIRARLGDIFISGAPGDTASPFVSVYGMAGVTLDGSDTSENITATASFKYSGAEFIQGYSSATMNANAITLTGKGQQGNYSTVIEDSGKLLKYDTNTAYSQSMDYHFTVSGDPTSTTHEIWSHYTAWPTDSGEYRQTKYGYDGVMLKSGIYDSGSHSASDSEATLGINQLRIFNKNSTGMVTPTRINAVTRPDSNTTAAGILADGWLRIYSADYWSNNCRTDINGGPVAKSVTIEWSPSASGTFRNSGAGIFLQNWNPAVINESIAGMFIDCEGFEYHDHSLNQYYTGGDIWRSASWYQNSWSIMSTGANHMGIINARPANGHDEYGDSYWLTMEYQGWTTSGLNTKVAQYSERSAQYSYSGTRYVQDNGISASYTPTGMVFTSGGETLTLSFDKIKSLLALVH